MPGAASAPRGPATAGAVYAEHAPPPALGRQVECFWSRAPDDPTLGGARSHRVIPDGCVDVILGFATAGPRAPDAAFAVGAMTRPVVYRDSARVTYVAVRFRPGVAGVLLGVPASELTDERVPLVDLWPEAEVLFDALVRTPDTSGRIRTLSGAVARRLLAASAGPPAVVVPAAERIAAARGNLSVNTLAADLGVTRQHLARSFARHVGLSPKMLARVVRARHVVRRLRSGRDAEWTALALGAGYYDQSHLIADLKELTGLSPSAWAEARS